MAKLITLRSFEGRLFQCPFCKSSNGLKFDRLNVSQSNILFEFQCTDCGEIKREMLSNKTLSKIMLDFYFERKEHKTNIWWKLFSNTVNKWPYLIQEENREAIQKIYNHFFQNFHKKYQKGAKLYRSV